MKLLLLALHYTSLCSVLLPATITTVSFRVLPKTLKLLGVFIFFTLGLEAISIVFSKCDINNLIFFHVHTIVETLFLIHIFMTLIGNKWVYRFGYIFLIGFVSFAIIHPWINNSFQEFNSLERGISGLAILIFCVIFFGKLIIRLEIERLMDYPYFLMASGLLFYFSGTLFSFLYANEYLNTTDQTNWLIHSLLNILLNLIFAITLWKGRKWTS